MSRDTVNGKFGVRRGFGSGMMEMSRDMANGKLSTGSGSAPALIEISRSMVKRFCATEKRHICQKENI